MATETIKSLREKADALIAKGVNNKDALHEALPVIIDLKFKAEFARKSLTSAVKTLTTLSDLCSKYALSHESVFEKKQLITSQQGVRVGDVVLEDATYHFANGFDGYERDDDGKLTQDFLLSLPAAWRKQSYKLSTTGIDESHPTEKDLARHCLRPKAKNEWSKVEEV